MNWDSIITIIITIIGFWVTIFVNNKNLRNEILKLKLTSQIEQSKDLAFKLCDLMQKLNKGQCPDDLLDTYADIMNKVLAYGSENALKIAVWSQQSCFQTQKNGNSYLPLVALSLLISQLRYDSIGITIPADTWFKMRITDYYSSGLNKEVSKIIHSVVAELNLNKGFLPKN